MLNRLIAHASNYTIGSLLVTLASVISFPIFTRTFSVAEYGALNLISSVLLLLTGIGKFGIQQSIVRFYAEVRAGLRGVSESQYFSTVLIGMGMTGLAATLGWAFLAFVIPGNWWNDYDVAHLMLPASGLILIRVIDSGICNLLQATQHSALFSIYSVTRKYAGLVVILLIMFYVVPRLAGFFLGTFIAEGSAVLIMGTYWYFKYRLSVAQFSPAIFKSMIIFGTPMIAYEIFGMVLNLGDRYVIQATLGAEPLGQYAAAYNLCEYLKVILVASFSQAVTPIYVRMWEEEGKEATQRFIGHALRLYLMVGMPVLAGVTAIGQDLITSLASEKYSAGVAVIPFVMAGMLIDGGVPLFGAGIYIQKQSRVVIPFVAGAAVLNILLNILLLPYFGIVAAGVATLVCYLLLAASAWRLGANLLDIVFPLWSLCKFAVLAAVMYEVVAQVSMPNLWLQLGSKIAIGVLVYSFLILAFDRQTRETLLEMRARLSGAA